MVTKDQLQFTTGERGVNMNLPIIIDYNIYEDDDGSYLYGAKVTRTLVIQDGVIVDVKEETQKLR